MSEALRQQLQASLAYERAKFALDYIASIAAEAAEMDLPLDRSQSLFARIAEQARGGLER